MTISVLVPWRPGCPYREVAWRWVQARYRAQHPDWELVEGTSPDGEFSRTAAILDAAARASGDVFVVADSDVWCEDIATALVHIDVGWAIPHLLIHRLSATSTATLLERPWMQWRGLPLSPDNRQDSKPYRGHETGTLVVLRAEVLRDVPPDPRFVGWGQEDDAWAAALRTLVGAPWRGNADLVHLYHPPQPRRDRVIGNDTNLELYRRYRAAKHHPDTMRALIDDGFPAEIGR